MARRRGPQPPKIPKNGLYIEAWMAIRGMERKDLSGALDTSEASISRYISSKRGVRLPIQRAMEKALRLPVGGLLSPPGSSSKEMLLAGLDEEKTRLVLNYIAFVHNQSK